MIEPIKNKKVQARLDEFLDIVEKNKDKTWYVCSHDNPDPDSLSSSLGMQFILRFLGVEHVTLTYKGEIGHPQNRAMVNVLDTFRLTRWEDIEETTDDDVFVFVDCSVNQKNMTIKKTPIMVIDHHKITANNKSILFMYDEVGACATLVLDLALSAIVDSEEGPTQCFDPDEETNKELATALSIGIKTDTMDFLSEATTDDDIKAFRLLARHLSNEKFHRIVNYEFPPYVLDYEQIAWQNKKSEFQPHCITGLKYIDETKSDCIPAIAEKFMRIQGVQTVVVYGIVGSSIRGSIRTSSASLDCQTLCDEIFGKGNGGTKGGSGGARVSFNVFDPQHMDDEGRESLWKLTKSQIESKFEKATSK